jgi:hypothetical protein
MIDTARHLARSARRNLTAAVMLTLVTAACSGDDLPTWPDYAYVKVTVLTTGGDLDVNGYTLVVDALQPKRMAGDSQRALESFALSPGAHGITLDNVAANCTVKGSNSRTVTAVSGQVAEVAFEVVCVPTGVAITTRTTGPDSPNALSLVVSDQPPMTISSNGSTTVSRLAPGNTSVTLSAPPHCTVEGGDRMTISVVANTVTSVAFEVTCTPAVRREKIAYALHSVVGSATVRWIGVVNVEGSTGAESLRPGDDPSWSPDGTRLAYSTTSCVDDFYYGTYCTGGLELLDPETGNFVVLSSRFGFHPSWSHSGGAIAFETGGNVGAQELAVMKPTSENFTTLLIAGPSSKERPSFSPDDKRIAFMCKWGVTSDICIVNADGTGLVRVTIDAQEDGDPAWSPDGTRMAFTRYPVGRSDEASAEIVVIDLATSRITTLTNGMEPAWSPDGSRLVFAGGDGLFIIGADGSNRTRLTTGKHHSPAWRP